MDKKNMIEKITPYVKDGKITCRQARKFAEEEGLSYSDMGELLNEHKIKLTNCQLGCF